MLPFVDDVVGPARDAPAADDANAIERPSARPSYFDPEARSGPPAGRDVPRLADSVPVTTTPMTDLRAEARRVLVVAGLPAAVAEADALVAAVLGRTRGDIELAALLGRPVDEADARRVRAALRRRARREPLQHVTGRAPFGDVELHVGPGAFVPRPETEGLVDLAVRVLRGAADAAAAPEGPAVVDLGAGTGAVAIGVARGVPDARVWAVEASPHAWPWLVRNARELGEGRVRPVFGPMIATPLPGAPAALDAVVSNPPYVPDADEPADPEVRLHDPAAALYGGADGLDVVRRIVAYAARVLRPGGSVLLEHDERQGEAIRALLTAAGLVDGATHPDLAGRDRVTGARRP